MYRIIGGDGREYGPISAEQVRLWMAQRRADAATKIKAEGAADWTTIGQLPEFSGGGAPPIVGAAPAPDPADARTSGMAITSLVLGVVGILSCGITSVVGLILGIVSLVKIKNSAGRLKGQGLAIAGIIVSAVFLVLIPVQAALLLPALSKAKTRAQAIKSVSNVKLLLLAVRLHAGDNDDKYPPAASWCDAILTEAGSPKVFQSPDRPDLPCGYAFNARLGRMEDGKIDPSTVVIFESDAGWNAAGGPEIMIKTPRHDRTFVIGFADGSVQKMTADKLPALRWDP